MQKINAEHALILMGLRTGAYMFVYIYIYMYSYTKRVFQK